MAELAALGVAASIAQFVAIAYKVTSRINTYCSALENTPEVFRRLRVDLPLLTEVCEKYSALGHVNTKAVQDALTECAQQIDDLHTNLVRAVPIDGDSNPVRWKKALKSFALETKVKDSISRLETLQNVLQLDISLMTYAVLKPPATSEPDRKCICVPSGRLSKFFGRMKLLDLIDNSLKPGGRDPKVCVLRGMGGQGKTSLALEYCKREMASGYFKSILWVEAKSLGSVHRSFAHFAESLTDNQRRFADNNACVNQVRNTLQTWATPWLVVYDNYDRLNDLPGILDYLPSSHHGAVLVTSRNPGCESLGRVIQVNGMELDESIQFFLDRIGLEPSTKTIQSAREVVTALENLPLAIDQSAAYIRARKLSAKEFLSHYRTRKLKVMKFIPEMTTYMGFGHGGADGEEKPLSVFTTWEMSRGQIWNSHNITAGEADSIAHFLTTLSFFGNLNLRMDMFRVYFETRPRLVPWMDIFTDSDTPEWDDLAYREVLSTLEQLWLIRYQEEHSHEDSSQEGHQLVSFHPLVQSWIQLRLDPQTRRLHCIEALEILHEYVLSQSSNGGQTSLRQRRETLSHLDSALEWQNRYINGWELDGSYSLRHACGDFMRYYIAEGKYNEAEMICKSLLKLSDWSGRFDEMVSSHVDLASIYIHQGRYPHAERELLQANAIQHSKPLTPLTKIRLARTLGLCYFKQGHYVEAEASYRTALESERETAALSSSDASDTNELLAQVCRDLGRHEEAINLYQSALESYAAKSAPVIRQLECKIHLANTYRALARNHEAALLYHDAHEGLLERLGHDHPLVIEAKLYNGINCIALENYAFAIKSLDQVITLASRVLGEKHPVALKARMNQAKALQYDGRIEEAESLYRITLEGREEMLGLSNPYTLRSYEDLVSLLWTQKRFDQAEATAERVSKVYRRQTSAENTSDPRQSPASSQNITNDTPRPFPATELLFKSAVARCTTTLDVAHRDRIDLQQALAQVYIKQGRFDEASDIRQQMEESETRTGAERP